MKTITVYYDNTWYTLSWLKQLLICKKIFRQKNIRIRINGPDKFVPKMESVCRPLKTKEEYLQAFSKQHDIVFIAYHHPSGLCGFSAEDRADCLRVLREHAELIVWLDTADSTGTCLFDVLPFVDKYLKKQLFSDLTLYQKDLYGDRLFTDYYHNAFGIDDPKAADNFGRLPSQYFDKLGVSWNIGLSDMFSYDKIKRIFRPGSFQSNPFTNTSDERPFDIQFRSSIQEGIYGYQRRKALETVKNCPAKTVDYSVDPHGKAYREEMSRSKAVVSPYGFGEICIRDFEVFYAGAVLLKPDMSHIKTYPDWYIPAKTYLPVKWDFSDFEETLNQVVTHRDSAVRIAENAQNLFRKYRTQEAYKKEFVHHLLSEIGLEEHPS